MSFEETNIDQLFMQAREQAPEASFDDTKKSFVKAIAIGGVGFLATKSIAYLFKLKFSVMILSTASIVAVSTIVVMQNNIPQQEPTQNNVPIVASTHEDIIEPLDIQQPDSADALTYIAFMPEEEILMDIETEASVEEKIEAPIIHANEKLGHAISNTRSVPRSIRQVGIGHEQDTTKRSVPNGNSFSTTITHHTTYMELDKIKAKAEKAGVDFVYSAKVKNNYIRKLDLQMSIDSHKAKNDRSTSHITVSGNDFKVNIGWVMDDSGQALRFKSGHTSSCDEANVDLDIESILLKSELALARLVERLEEEFSDDSLEAYAERFESFEDKIEHKIEAIEIHFENCKDCEKNTDLKGLESNLNRLSKELECIVDKTVNSDKINCQIKCLESKLKEIEESFDIIYDSE